MVCPRLFMLKHPRNGDSAGFDLAVSGPDSDSGDRRFQPSLSFACRLRG
jgi:hypothetical protein